MVCRWRSRLTVRPHVSTFEFARRHHHSHTPLLVRGIVSRNFASAFLVNEPQNAKLNLMQFVFPCHCNRYLNRLKTSLRLHTIRAKSARMALALQRPRLSQRLQGRACGGSLIVGRRKWYRAASLDFIAWDDGIERIRRIRCSTTLSIPVTGFRKHGMSL